MKPKGTKRNWFEIEFDKYPIKKELRKVVEE